MSDDVYRKKLTLHEEMEEVGQSTLNDMNPLYHDPATKKFHKGMRREGEKLLGEMLNPFEFFK